MAVIDVYRQYFSAECVFNGVERKGALVTLTSDSECGNIRYEAAVTFFPHRDAEDFAVSYDACAAVELYNQRGRRSRKREAVFLEELRGHVDAAAQQVGGTILWEQPLTEASLA